MYAPKILIFYQSLGEITKHKFGIQRSVEIAVLAVFQQVEWHSFVYSSSCGCLLMLKFCDDSECESPDNFGICRLGKNWWEDRWLTQHPICYCPEKSASRQSPFLA
jgi:hypothetical protein